MEKKKLFTTQNLIRMALLSAVAVVLMQFDLSIPMFFPAFLKVDLSEVPSLVGILVINPWAGLVIPLIKNIIDAVVFGSTTGYVGEFSNYIVSVAYLLPLILIVRHRQDLRAIILGVVLGILLATLVGSISNYYIVLPLYSRFMPIEQIIQMGTALNSRIHDLKTFVIYIMIPFNIFKTTVVSIAGVGLVNAIRPVISMLRSNN